ncbi:MAG: TetR/AcrR family transcriptional regulator [Vicinamibacterales bacterium]
MARFPSTRPVGAAGAAPGRRRRPRPPEGAPVPARKPRNAYHHGHLRQALVDQAVATIGARGVEALTLREVGASLRVSRTALYRHFADKTALLAAVAAQGFRTFREALRDAWDDGGRGRAGFMGMGRAYVRFALAHPSHYRVMFGGFVTKAACDPGLEAEAGDAFGVLVGAITELQGQGLVRAGDPTALGVYVWASTHGLAMLAIDGQLGRKDVPLEALMAVLLDRVWDGLAA